MTKTDANNILDFIRRHYDMVSQEDWFDLCDMLIEVIGNDANRSTWGRKLAEENPDFFKVTVRTNA